MYFECHYNLIIQLDIVCYLSYNVIEVIRMDARVDSRVPVDVKEKASKELAAHGLSISSFIRMTLSSVANDGLPKYWGIPNAETMLSISEAVDDLNDHKLKGASSYDELEKLLNEWSYYHKPF